MNKEIQLEFPFMDEIRMIELAQAEQQARFHAKTYINDESHVYWFPNEQTVRLLVVSDDNMPATCEPYHVPCYFDEKTGLEMGDGNATSLGVCECRWGEQYNKKLPDGWGEWDDAILLEGTSDKQ